MADTYVLLTHCEVVLHGFLRILIQWLFLCLLSQREEEVDEDQGLDQDVALKCEVA